jgi:hypothetical protein
MCEHGETRGAKFCALCRVEGITLKFDGITQSADFADGTWWAACQRALLHLAQTQDTFTADDVLALVDAQGYTTKDNRALGGVMRNAAIKGIIRETDRFIPSSNKRKHGSPTRVWESCKRPAQIELL